MELKLNITLNGSLTEMILPVEEDMLTIDFYLSLQMLLKSLVDNITTFDIYNESFQRIALVGDDNELFMTNLEMGLSNPHKVVKPENLAFLSNS